MSYWQTAGAFQFPNSEDPHTYVQDKAIEKFKECLRCIHFSTFCESYRCDHPQGKDCLLQLGVNFYQKK